MNINILLAECEGRTASYGPSFFLPFMAQARSGTEPEEEKVEEQKQDIDRDEQEKESDNDRDGMSEFDF